MIETRGILLLLIKSFRLRLGLLESITVLTPVGGKKFWIVGFFGLFVLADMLRCGLYQPDL